MTRNKAREKREGRVVSSEHRSVLRDAFAEVSGLGPELPGNMPRPLTAPLPPGQERPNQAIVLAMRRETAE